MSRFVSRSATTRLITNCKSSRSIPTTTISSQSRFPSSVSSSPRPSRQSSLSHSSSNRHFSASRSIANATSPSSSSTQPSSGPNTTAREPEATPESGPIARYSHLVETGLLRDDEFQRSIIQKLQKLHDELKSYRQKLPPKEEAKVKVKGGLVSWDRAKHKSVKKTRGTWTTGKQSRGFRTGLGWVGCD